MADGVPPMGTDFNDLTFVIQNPGHEGVELRHAVILVLALHRAAYVRQRR